LVQRSKKIKEGSYWLKTLDTEEGMLILKENKSLSDRKHAVHKIIYRIDALSVLDLRVTSFEDEEQIKSFPFSEV
jgi:hypothetical protein